MGTIGRRAAARHGRWADRGNGGGSRQNHRDPQRRRFLGYTAPHGQSLESVSADGSSPARRTPDRGQESYAAPSSREHWRIRRSTSLVPPAALPAAVTPPLPTAVWRYRSRRVWVIIR